MCVYVPPAIWTAQVNGAHTQGARSIAVDNVSQVRAPARNFQVWFGTSAGSHDISGDVPVLFRSYSSGTLVIGENNLTLPDNTYITINEVVPPAAVLPDIDDDDVVTEDGGALAYTDENEHYPPLARCGAHAVAYRDEATGLATVKFYSRSAAMADGATITAHLWVWRGGTVVAGSTTTAGTEGSPNVVTWDASGDYYCSYRCTDSNGKTHTRYFVVFVRDRAIGLLPYRQLEITNRPEADRESGVWKTGLRVWTTATVAEFPNQALIVLAAADYFGSEQVSIGVEPYRENVVLIGYIRSGSVKCDRLGGSVEFDVESPSGVMDNLTAVAGGLERASGTPSGWHSLANLDYNLAVHHLLTQHSTLSQIVDVYLNLLSYGNEYIDVPEGSLSAQLKSVVGAVRGVWGSSSLGHLYFETVPLLQDVDDRSTDYVLATTNADLIGEIDLGTEQHEKQVAQVEFNGVNDVGDPFFSVAPPKPWSQGGQPERVDEILVADQDEANTLAGLYEGMFNNDFAEIPLAWRGNYRIFDIFPIRPIQLNVAASQNRRGIVWVNERCWTKRMTYDYRPGGILMVSTVVERDAYGPPGSGDGEPGDDGGIDYPPTLPPLITIPPLPITRPLPPPLSAGTRQIYDFDDGWDASEALANTTVLGIRGRSNRRFRVTSFRIASSDTGFTVNGYFGSLTNAAITCKHEADNTWTFKRYNTSTGALISTRIGAAGTSFEIFLTGGNIVTVSASNLPLRTEIVTADSPATVDYGIGGETY